MISHNKERFVHDSHLKIKKANQHFKKSDVYLTFILPIINARNKCLMQRL